MEARILRQLSARLNARIDGLEPRLNPAPRLRPPLASDKRKETAQGAQLAATRPKPKTATPEPEVTTLTPPANPGRQEKRKRREKVTAAAKEAAATRRDGSPKTPGAAEGTPSKEWTKVSNRKGQKKAVPPPKKEHKQRRLRAPKSAAVVITLQPEATDRGVSYKDVLERGKKRIDLAAMDIGAVKFKVAVTGARMLEVSGSGCKEKANLLADRLKEVLAEDARISRPQKCAELRVSGLDDSASAPEIAAAIANSGLCAAEEVKVGEIRRNRGRGTAWVRCPVEAAKRVTAKGCRTNVGWTVVQEALINEISKLNTPSNTGSSMMGYFTSGDSSQ
ncbi:unnamed protein product [Danaus chrysippus]|uniref:(African queen) hypothetical protein n=1 Tax=Danaus chrysippus TaxID=151541 RepID=A0A8J2QSD2_9NEOP|nr:unnamed protein product [Danaus chrysippus]